MYLWTSVSIRMVWCISEICDRYLKHPSEVLSVGDVVKVVVLGVDEKKKRISLSMKQVGK